MTRVEGVTTVFGYPGGAILPTYDAMLDYPIKHVLVRHEQGASHMADGYARAGGGVGVAIATSGPGATNLVTGIATAQMDSVPMVCITGQVPSKLIGYDAFQETDITGITLPITKHSYLVTRCQDIMPAMKEAFHLAKSGRPGPVLVDITKDAQQAKIDWAWDPSPVRLRGYRPRLTISRGDIDKAVHLIQSARKPVILAGQGILQSGAMSEVRQFAERIKELQREFRWFGQLDTNDPIGLFLFRCLHRNLCLWELPYIFWFDPLSAHRQFDFFSCCPEHQIALKIPNFVRRKTDA